MSIADIFFIYFLTFTTFCSKSQLSPISVLKKNGATHWLRLIGGNPPSRSKSANAFFTGGGDFFSSDHT